MSRPGRALRLGLLCLVVAACSGPILANPPLRPEALPTPSPRPTLPADPQPIVLPRDDGPHDRLTEWWYYTGHLRAGDGRHFGFEAVVFRAERGSLPVSWASHLALTDESTGRFLYTQRSQIGPQFDRSPRAPDGSPTGFDLIVAGSALNPDGTLANPPWRLAGAAGQRLIIATLSSTENQLAGGYFGLDLDLTDLRPPVLHGGDGWIDFGPAGGSYYYSVPRIQARGVVLLDGEDIDVDGSAWFDHQWGDFISVGGGGWDWFAVNLDDGSDLTVSLVRAADGSYPLIYGTYVDVDGRVSHLDRDAVHVEATPGRTWTSPATGATYPAAWTIQVPGKALVIELEPTAADQELDTRPTTGVAYWEGSQVVTGTRAGMPVSGQAYVELTGYAPAVTSVAP